MMVVANPMAITKAACATSVTEVASRIAYAVIAA